MNPVQIFGIFAVRELQFHLKYHSFGSIMLVYEMFIGLINFTDQTFLGFCVQNFGPRMAKFVVSKKEAVLNERQNKIK